MTLHVVRQVFYHLGEYDDALTFALGASDLFDVAEESQYVNTMISKCIDKYIQLSITEGAEIGVRYVACIVSRGLHSLTAACLHSVLRGMLLVQSDVCCWFQPDGHCRPDVPELLRPGQLQTSCRHRPGSAQSAKVMSILFVCEIDKKLKQCIAGWNKPSGSQKIWRLCSTTATK